jgi:hypothetical protein
MAKVSGRGRMSGFYSQFWVRLATAPIIERYPEALIDM